MQLEKLGQLIYDLAKQEERDLAPLAPEGIFYMPELAFAYQCGKAVMRDPAAIFGTDKVTWHRERDLGNGGPTDLLFELDDGRQLAIEFKLRSTSRAYQADVNKLAQIDDGNCTKLFCALVDVFSKDLPDDGRQRHIEAMSTPQVTVVFKHEFATRQQRYASAVSCVVALWQIH
ncbi:hypothetical protein [uncultured Ferrimonas sp.]|uniref:hypothetical protein n=1 Tax=uncultured Ferrimonas sp. TaxID=432640 RepID=UPI0026036422|nr:hypothetical protein [uncultured Ferrimonas sp.]